MDLYSLYHKYHLICEGSDVAAMRPSTITDFYLASYLHDVVDESDKDDINEIILNLREKYLKAFQPVLINQLRKYITRGRMVKDVDERDLANASFDQLDQYMNLSRRSDMKRENKRWNMLSDYLAKLSHERRNVEKIKEVIDRINNTVHNTGESMLTKFDNARELLDAFDLAAEGKISDLVQGSGERVLKKLEHDYRFMHEDTIEKSLQECSRKQKIQNYFQNLMTEAIDTYLDIGHTGNKNQAWYLKSMDSDIVYSPKNIDEIELNRFHRDIEKEKPIATGRVDHPQKMISISSRVYGDKELTDYLLKVFQMDFPKYEVYINKDLGEKPQKIA
jgi:hypothetical protein